MPTLTRNDSRTFVLPKYPQQIDTDDYAVVMLDPFDKDYQKHLKAIQNAKLLCLDTETFGVDSYKQGLHPWQSKIRLIQLFDGQTVYVADLSGRSLNSLPLFATEADPQEQRKLELKDFLSVLKAKASDTAMVMHNAHFDCLRLLVNLGITVEKPVCTMLGTQVYFGDYGKGSEDRAMNREPILKGGYSLKNLSKRFLGITVDKTEQKSDWGDHLTKAQIDYAANDTVYTWHLYQYLVQLYRNQDSVLYSKSLMSIWKLENQIITATCEMEVNGVAFDRAIAEQQINEIEIVRSQLLAEWEQICPLYNYGQIAQLTLFLASQYGIRLDDLNKSSLAEHGNNPLIKLRLKLKGLDAKLNNLKGFMRSAARDGRVHTVFRTLTGFGRFSSGDSKNYNDLPNMQSVSAKENPLIREYNLSNPRESIRVSDGKSFLVIDLAGAHGRIAADQANDAVAIAGNNDDSIDNHSKVAVYVAKAQNLDWDWETIAKLKSKKTPEGRQAKSFRDTAKNTYYGWLNGAGARRIQAQIAGNTGESPLLEACEGAIEGCKILYPEILEHRKQLHTRLKATAITLDGRLICINSTSDGARLLLPLEMSDYTKEWEAPYTQSLAAIWSRIEATAVKNAIVQIRSKAKDHPEWELKLCLVVHDEVDYEYNSEYDEQVATTLRDIVGDCFQAQMQYVNDGREKDWTKLVCKSWAEK